MTDCSGRLDSALVLAIGAEVTVFSGGCAVKEKDIETCVHLMVGTR